MVSTQSLSSVLARPRDVVSSLLQSSSIDYMQLTDYMQDNNQQINAEGLQH